MGGLDGRDNRSLTALGLVHELATDRLNIEQMKLITELFDVLTDLRPANNLTQSEKL